MPQFARALAEAGPDAFALVEFGPEFGADGQNERRMGWAEAAYILEDSGAAILFVGQATAARGLEAAEKAGVPTVVIWGSRSEHHGQSQQTKAS